MRAAQRQSTFLLLLSLAVSSAHAGLDARGWLARMDEAARTVSYTGTFVYRHGNMLDTMRVFHLVGPNGIRERLQSLNGVPREIIRGRQEIKCYLPDQKTLIVERRADDRKGFPGVLPRHVAPLDPYYRLALGGQARVAGRPAQIVQIQPRDQYRYGYRLWADAATGLLLRSDLLDGQGRVIEQFMFTQVDPGARITTADLAPPPHDRFRRWQREAAEKPMPDAPKWHLTALPPGFQLQASLVRAAGDGQPRVTHLVYSDGLAAVSVFIQKLKDGAASSMVGLRRMGAVHVYGRVEHGHQVTVVGEVPTVTVRLIGASVQPVSAQ